MKIFLIKFYDFDQFLQNIINVLPQAAGFYPTTQDRSATVAASKRGEDASPQVHKGYYTFAIVLRGSPRVYVGTAAKDIGV